MSQIPVFIVNLPKDQCRKEHMQKLCAPYPINFQFIEAINGDDLSQEFVNQITSHSRRNQGIGRKLTKGEVGCALSHLSIYKYVLENDIKQAVVLEDDIEFDEHFTDVINMVDKFPNNWELLLLGYKGEGDEHHLVTSWWKRVKISNNHSVVRLPRPVYGTHGYMINLRGAKKLVDQLSKISMPIDHYTGVDFYTNLYAIYPPVVRLHKTLSTESGIKADRINYQNTMGKGPFSSLKNVLKYLRVHNAVKRIYFSCFRIKLLKSYD